MTICTAAMERTRDGIRLELLEEHGRICPGLSELPREAVISWLQRESVGGDGGAISVSGRRVYAA